MQHQDPSALLTVAEVATRLRVSPRTVYALLRDGTLKSVRIAPRATRVEAGEVERYVREAREGSAS